MSKLEKRITNALSEREITVVITKLDFRISLLAILILIGLSLYFKIR